ncbi:ComF family protein [Bosea sp. FBZP-16]|uniref:ComF family protein n=1 Tax=Bosea sp. FBZP-16 TaxID=2065382 RepID=UPI000C303989|nr:ComF family protein [Bosea sp. FBZP-16]
MSLSENPEKTGKTLSLRWLQRGGGWLRTGVTSVIGLVYPPSCVGCRAATSEAQGLCAQCWAGLGLIERPYCERLGTPFEVDLGPGLVSPAAIADPPVFARARAACRFDGTARELVHRLKYGDRTELSLMLGRMMAQAGRELIVDADLIVPVPLHRFRLWTRRFNQAAALAATIAGQSGRPCAPQALARVKRTRQQVGLTRAQRADNLQGAFKVLPAMRPLVEGRRILLVDDVLTTGSTVNAASRALLRGGASAVDVLTFARVVTEA